MMPRNDLGSHANMVAVGKNCAIIREAGRNAEVALFTPDNESLHEVTIVDTAIEYYDK